MASGASPTPRRRGLDAVRGIPAIRQRELPQRAKWGLDYLEGTGNNPNYEILLSYGAYTAARMNAEQGTTYDVEKLVNWVFEPSSTVRSGWGCIVGSWNGYQVNGLMGSTTDGGGYAFSFPTFANRGRAGPQWPATTIASPGHRALDAQRQRQRPVVLP
jgi:hypothetical protein